MSYTALYRKLRPSQFGEVVGQEHIVTTLKNQISGGRISHAYLMCGTRGTGKTSTAKIFAKAINCEAVKDGEPCNVCASCEVINSGKSMNVIEIDAASNNGVDNIRDIRDDVKYIPSEGKYKVYIIDEVHMLSTGAFNALLKTLEEPPKHVIFILATTDPQKIPPTIHSRCQRYDFKRISLNEMIEAIKGYMLDENIIIADDALGYIARISDGAMRDALSIIDQLSAFHYNEEITLDKALKSTGGAGKDALFELLYKFHNRQTAECLEMVKSLVSDGRDLNRIVNELLEHCRDNLVAVSVKGTTLALDYSSEYIEKLREQGELIGKETLIYYIDVFSGIQSAVKYSQNPRILLETACIKICNPQADDNISSLFSKVKALEARFESNLVMTNISTEPNPEHAKKLDPEAKLVSSKPKVQHQSGNSAGVVLAAKAVTTVAAASLSSSLDEWSNFVLSFGNSNKNAFIKKLIDKSKAVSLSENTLYIMAPDSVYNMRSIANGETLILEAAKVFFNVDVQFISESEYDKRYAALHGSKPAKRYDFEDILNFKVEFVDSQ